MDFQSLKHNKLFITLFCLLLFVIGVNFGQYINENYDQETHTLKREKVVEQGKIAIVNLDTGSTDSKGRLNVYSDEIIKVPDGFCNVGLQNAEDGLKKDYYVAYIVIPENFSESIDSINGKPEKAVIKYELNTHLSKSKQKDVLCDIYDYEKDITSRISEVYLNTILKDVHKGQTKSLEVLANNGEDLLAVKNIKGEELSEDLYVRGFEEPKQSDLSSEVKAKDNSKIYDNVRKNIGDVQQKSADIKNQSTKESYDKLKENIEKKLTYDESSDDNVSKIIDYAITEVINVYNNRINEIKRGKPNGKQHIVVLSDEELNIINETIEYRRKNDVDPVTNEAQFNGLSEEKEKYSIDETDELYIYDDNTTNYNSYDHYLFKDENDVENKAKSEGLKKEVENFKKEIIEGRNGIISYGKNLVKAETDNVKQIEHLKKDVINKDQSVNKDLDAAIENDLSNEKSNTDRLQKISSHQQDYSNSVNKYIMKASNDIDKHNDNNDKLLSRHLGLASRRIVKNTNNNELLLTDFINTLPNTKINGSLNSEYVDKVSTPASINNNQSIDNEKIHIEKNKKERFDYSKLAIIIILLLMVLIIIFNVLKNKDDKEEYNEVEI